MTNEINLGYGDSDNVPAILYENGTGADLTGASVVFAMKNDVGTASFDITCTDGATVAGSNVLKSAGGMTIPFTTTQSMSPGLYFGKFLVTITGVQTTFPSGSDSITVRISEEI